MSSVMSTKIEQTYRLPVSNEVLSQDSKVLIEAKLLNGLNQACSMTHKRGALAPC